MNHDRVFLMSNYGLTYPNMRVNLLKSYSIVNFASQFFTYQLDGICYNVEKADLQHAHRNMRRKNS